MTREEFKLIVKGLKAVFSVPSFIPDMDAFNIWYELLKDMDYELCSLAVQNYMATETKIPTVADIRNKAMKFKKNDEPNEMQAWALVSKAIKNGLYNSEEEFNKLPKMVQKAVGSADMIRSWATNDSETNQTVVSSNFMRTYRTVVARESEMSRLPASIQTLIAQTETNPKLIEKGEYE